MRSAPAQPHCSRQGRTRETTTSAGRYGSGGTLRWKDRRLHLEKGQAKARRKKGRCGRGWADPRQDLDEEVEGGLDVVFGGGGGEQLRQRCVDFRCDLHRPRHLSLESRCGVWTCRVLVWLVRCRLRFGVGLWRAGAASSCRAPLEQGRPLPASL
eukprot:1061356-Rhodomonas_salina.1